MIGPNGSGKTLFASALAGQVPIIGGEAIYHFKPLQGSVPEDAVALVSFEQQKNLAGDDPAALRWFSAEDEETKSVHCFLSRESVCEINPYEIREESPRAATLFYSLQKKILRLLQIEHLTGHTLTALSNGEMRKTLIARALLKRPRLVILDDPFAGLDAHFHTHLKRILTRLMQRPDFHLLLIAKHLDELPRGITHLACIEECRITAAGPLRKMLKHPVVRAAFHSDEAVTTVSTASGFSFPSDSRQKQRPSSNELVRMEKVSIACGKHTIFENIDWAVRRNEHWALLGPNGSGKSTLLSLVIGDNPQAYANRINLFGKPRDGGESIWNIKKRIGWVSSELHLHFPEGQSCLDAVLTGFQDSYGCFRRPTAVERRIGEAWLESFHLTRYAQKSFGALSAGLQRMTLLARALVKSPELLVLDEPCQGLDAAYRGLFVRAVEELIRLGSTTVIYVTHRKDEIPRGIKQVLRMPWGNVTRRRGTVISS